MFRGGRQVFQVGQAPSGGPHRNSTTADTDRSATYHSNFMGLSRIVYEINGNICKKKFPTPVHLTSPAEGVPIGIL